MQPRKRKGEAGLDDDVDLVLRHVSRQFPREVARALCDADQKLVEPLGWVETQVTGRQRRLDRALSVKVGDERRLLHAEWTLTMTEEIAFRVFEYHNLTALAAADEARGGRGKPLPIESVVIVLSGREEPWPAHAAYRTSPARAPFCGVHFRIEPVYQRTVAELEARGSAFWMIFTPLAVDADARNLEAVLEALRARTNEREFAELGAAMVALADADKRERRLADVVHSCLSREIVMQNRIFREGKAMGIEEGFVQGQLAVLARQVERRLRRPLRTDEQEQLAEHLRVDGPDAVADAIFDPESHERWRSLLSPRTSTQ
ncbi:hypothetical protein [Polyangium sp. 15x6]|uniref:hypothetical protein n=1 Tax=Polyangium sp. 15x6 TaxID=3042687 RepID=UPI00249C9965|nr:hypothetical protein [Polyangium sp. 15x6]MDI3288892.1 hypothetical protein [Polyangium sp. 15x6]